MLEDAPKSVHGGELPFDERWIRRSAQAKLFGDAPPVTLGRYTVRERLGAGGMGTVYAAWDPELERDVAIKVLHAREPRAAERLRREARALAALAHPHVVMVFEVGQSEGVLFIVMEFVDGTTLRQWQHDRSTDEVLGAYLQAGEGLEAAHRAGLVHGDFKPDNVLVHDDGRVRVADFGLAARGPLHPSGEEHAQTLPTSATTGGGTPGYQAPEIGEGRAADHRSDQYSFCVALCEGIAAKRVDGVDATTNLDTSRRVRAALARGLDPDPAQRFDSMEALLAALKRPRRTWLLAPLAAATVAVVALLSRGPACDQAGPRPWSQAREQAQAHFESADAAWVTRTWPVLDVSLQAHEDALAHAHLDACRVEPGRSAELATNAQACFAEAWRELDVFASSLARGDRADLRTAALRLPSLMSARACNDEDALAHFEPANVPELRERLLSSLLSHARLPGSQPVYDPELVELAARHGGVLEALARRVRAHDALGRGAREAAIEDLQVAAALAEAAGDDTARIEALALLSFAIGQDTRRLVEAKRVATQALSALDAGTPRPLVRAKLLHNLASVAAHARPPDFEAALRMHEDAARTLTDALGPSHPATLRAQLSLGTALTRARRIDEALAVLTAVDAQIGAQWTRTEPTWIRSRRAVGLALLAHGDSSEALVALQEVQAARGSTHPEPVARARDAYNVALALRALDRNAEAHDSLARAYPLAEGALGRDHPELTPWVALLGKSSLALERHPEAARWFKRGLELCELDGAAPKEFAKLRVGLAESLAFDDANAARVHLDGALRFLGSTQGFDGLRTRALALDEALKARVLPTSAGQPQVR